MLPRQHLELLKEFVALCKEKPDLLSDPQLSFFADFVRSLGGNVPEATNAESASAHYNDESSFPSAAEPEDEEPIVESDLEIDNEGVVQPDKDIDLPMGEEGIEITEDMVEKSNDKRAEAASQFSDGNYQEAFEAYTEAIKLNPGSALLHAKRANVLIHLKKPNAAIKDCNKALSINPDSAQAYKYRGRAHRLLGNFEEAHTDLATACKFDYDDEANAWLKEVEPNYKKIFEHKRKHERKLEEREERKRQERRKRAQEAYEKSKAEPKSCCAEDDECDAQSGAGGIPAFLNDPEIMTAFKDPEVMKAFAEVSQNPMNMAKYQNNPKVMKVLEKLASKMGTGQGMPGSFFQRAASGAEAKPKSAKPDIDID